MQWLEDVFGIDGFIFQVLGALIGVVIVVWVVSSASGTTYPVNDYACHDGDTCKLDIVLDEHSQSSLGVLIYSRTTLPQARVRLCGIDAPDLNSTKGNDKLKALAARDWLSAKLRAARTLEVEILMKKRCKGIDGVNCARKDRYGRFLGYLYADGKNINELILAEGLAVPEEKLCK